MITDKEKLEYCIADAGLAFIQDIYEESLRLAQKALSIDSHSPDAHQCAGNAYMSKADYKSAIGHYKKALENDADNGDRYFNNKPQSSYR
ncbi:MAG: tetratricopeptide repeat protein [Oscillospiraceae bacterium]|nr:tetratricopeptide repeat protein [Oscillospiraceae bacterium]